METLSKLLCTDVVFEILEFLIDFDYTPFRLKDVVRLRSKILDWKYSVGWAHDNGRVDLFMFFMSEAPVDTNTFSYTMHAKVPVKVLFLKSRYAQIACGTNILVELDPIYLLRGCVGSCVANAGILEILTTGDLNVAYLTNYEIYLSVAFFALEIKPYRISYSSTSFKVSVEIYSRGHGYCPISYDKNESYFKSALAVFESSYSDLWNRFLMLSCIVSCPKLICVKYAIDRRASNSSRCLRKLLKSLNKNPNTCSLDHLEIIEYLFTETEEHKTKLMIDCMRTIKYLTIVCQTNLPWCSILIFKFQSVTDRISKIVEPHYDALCRTISHNCLLERTVIAQPITEDTFLI